MKKLLSMLTVSTLVGTSASNLKPLFTSNVNQSFKSNQTNKNVNIHGENDSPFISKIKLNGFPTPYISAMAVAPDGTIYAGAVWQGLYKSTNGKDFQQVTNVIPTDLLIKSISISNDGNKIYVASQQKGLYSSIDGGQTFTKFDKFDDGQHAESTYIAPNGNIYISAGRGLYSSIDGGQTFNLVLSGISVYFVVENSNGIIYAGGSDGFYSSIDGGQTFTKVNELETKGSKFKVCSVAIDGTIYVGIDDNPESRGLYKSGLYKSTDGGKTFTKVNELDEGKIIDVTGVVINSNGTIFVTSGTGLYVSSDFSKTFNKLQDVVSDLIEPLTVAPDNTIYACSSGNYYKFNLSNYILEFNKPDYIGNKYKGFVYKNENQINIKGEYLESALYDGKSQTLPKTGLELKVGEHTLILTLKNEYKRYANLFGGDNNTGQVTYKLWVKTSIDKENINYSTNNNDTDLTDLSLGFVSTAGNTNGCPIIQTKTKDGSQHPATLNLKFDDILIDYTNSYYVQGTIDEATNDFTETGTHQNFSKNLSIKTDGIYRLHLLDTVGNEYDSYLELGDSNWKLKGSFNDETLNKLKTKLNVNVNLTDKKQLAQATGWLNNYDKFATDLFEKSVKANGKGFDEEIKHEKGNDFTWFLNFLTYEPNNEPNFNDGIDKDKLNKTIRDIANKLLKDGLSILPQGLNVDTKNVVNASTLTSYSNWIKNYQDFITNNKDQWINEKVILSGRGFATSKQIKKILDHINGLPFKNYLKHVEWSATTGLATSSDYQKLIDFDKLQNDTINWVNQNIPEINQAYQQAIKTAESGLNLHGYSIDTLLNGKNLPQNKDQIDNFADGQSFHNWLQSQANIKFHGWQLAMGFGIGIPLFLIALGIAWFVRKATDPRYNPFARGRKEQKVDDNIQKKNLKEIKTNKNDE